MSIQSQVLNLLNDLQDELGLTYIFISHDLSVVQHISDRIAVMYLGKIVEIGSADEIFSNPRHPYTKALLSSIPVPDVNVAKDREKIILKGDVPSPRKPPSGCAFHTRCAYKEAACSASLPTMFSLRENHAVACHLVERGDL